MKLAGNGEYCYRVPCIQLVTTHHSRWVTIGLEVVLSGNIIPPHEYSFEHPYRIFVVLFQEMTQLASVARMPVTLIRPLLY